MNDHSPPTNDVIIDTDPGLGRPLSDVDDALAIAFSVWAGLPVRALTSCFGNAPLAHTHRVTEDLARRFNLRAYRGASGPRDTDTPAVDALVAHRGTVIALAPMTNIAAALRRGARWERLVVLGGTRRRLPNLRPLHTTEFNLAVDRPAARVALHHATDVVPMEPCRKVWFGRPQLAGLPQWLAGPCEAWRKSSILRHGRFAFHPWDVLATALVSHPELFARRPRRVVLRDPPLYRGTVAYEPGNTQVVMDVDAIGLIQTWSSLVGSPVQ